jgi:predicted RNA-binding protein with PUA-like domain
MGAAAMAFWIFKCNPARFRLEDRLADPNPVTTWTVTRYRDEIGPGDTAFLWVTGVKRGIRGVMSIDQPPRLMAELPSEQQYWNEPDTDELLRVVGSLTHRNLDISAAELRDTPGLENLSMFHGFQQGTNFEVSDAEGQIIMNLIQRDSQGRRM